MRRFRWSWSGFPRLLLGIGCLANCDVAVLIVEHQVRPAGTHGSGGWIGSLVSGWVIVPAKNAVALRPMTLEEAIKEAHFRDRDVFVFRDPKGKVMVLHRTRDGKLELIEAP